MTQLCAFVSVCRSLRNKEGLSFQIQQKCPSAIVILRQNLARMILVLEKRAIPLQIKSLKKNLPSLKVIGCELLRSHLSKKCLQNHAEKNDIKLEKLSSKPKTMKSQDNDKYGDESSDDDSDDSDDSDGSHVPLTQRTRASTCSVDSTMETDNVTRDFAASMICIGTMKIGANVKDWIINSALNELMNKID